MRTGRAYPIVLSPIIEHYRIQKRHSWLLNDPDCFRFVLGCCSRKNPKECCPLVLILCACWLHHQRCCDAFHVGLNTVLSC